ncbi:hypothetical protein, partial [Rhizobium ruizarguesonis]|uniref:hypothetical protein n=1 Tax=Rhizobium ruizarguesonis TaxID=2081791 RepID=UPI001952D060
TPSRLSRPPSLPGLKRWSHQRSSALDASACQTGSAIESAPLTAEGSAGAGEDYGKPQVNKKKFGRRKRIRH